MTGYYCYCDVKEFNTRRDVMRHAASIHKNRCKICHDPACILVVGHADEDLEHVSDPEDAKLMIIAAKAARKARRN